METNSLPGKILVSEDVHQLLKAYPVFSLVERGVITVKGKGSMMTYWLEGMKEEFVPTVNSTTTMNCGKHLEKNIHDTVPSLKTI